MSIDRASLSSVKFQTYRGDVGYGPSRAIEVLIWLFIAVSLRYQAAAAQSGLSFIFMLTAWIALYFCIKNAANYFIFESGGVVDDAPVDDGRMINGTTTTMLIYAFVIFIITASMAIFFPGQVQMASGLLKGFDGIAFDHINTGQSVASALTAYFVLVVILEQKTSRRVKFQNVLGQMFHHARYVLPALVALVLAYQGPSYIQGFARQAYVQLIQLVDIFPLGLIFFAYMMFFSIVRLACSILFIGIALRHSIMRGGSNG